MGTVLSTLKQIGFLSLACTHLYCVSKLVQPGSNLFSWHPFLTSFAFGLIMPEAFTQISRLSEFGKRFSYRNRVTLHWILQVTAVILAGVGISCIAINKNQNNRPHLKSFHAWAGLITFIFAAFQSIGGLLIMNPKLRPASAPSGQTMKTYHACSAAALMMCASAALCFSNYSVYVSKHKLNPSVFTTGMWVYPGILAFRSLWTVYESGAFGRLCGSKAAPLVDPKDTSSL